MSKGGIVMQEHTEELNESTAYADWQSSIEEPSTPVTPEELDAAWEEFSRRRKTLDYTPCD